MKGDSPKLGDIINENELALVEAALYVAGRPLELGTLSSIIGTRSKERVLKLAQALVKRYRDYDSSLELLELKDQRFVIQMKAEFAPRVRRLSQRPILTRGPLKTLSYIVYHQPVLQKKVVEARGSHAYSHLKKLEELNLITLEGAGRTKVIRITPFFADYFGLSHDSRAMKRQLKSIFKQGQCDI